MFYETVTDSQRMVRHQLFLEMNKIGCIILHATKLPLEHHELIFPQNAPRNYMVQPRCWSGQCTLIPECRWVACNGASEKT